MRLLPEGKTFLSPASLEAAETAEEIKLEKGIGNVNPEIWDMNSIYFLLCVLCGLCER